MRKALLLLLFLLLVPVTPAQAAPLGGLYIVPGDSQDTSPMRLRTSGGCPAQADAFYAVAVGKGFPAEGQILTGNSDAGLSHNGPMDVFPFQTLKDYADDAKTTLDGQYAITVRCIESFSQNVLGEFTGALRFTDPHHYVTVEGSKPPAGETYGQRAQPQPAKPGQSAAPAPEEPQLPGAATGETQQDLSGNPAPPSTGLLGSFGDRVFGSHTSSFAVFVLCGLGVILILAVLVGIKAYRSRTTKDKANV
ncbi:hypothetical protein D5S17_18700 [Pseudonocardiaceae bacterium YIM PH 21723]|nr:hypothetical protein D5S17_18700 [Pseudonocardiaceae bacterium YIM PH 21723]